MTSGGCTTQPSFSSVTEQTSFIGSISGPRQVPWESRESWPCTPNRLSPTPPGSSGECT